MYHFVFCRGANQRSFPKSRKPPSARGAYGRASPTRNQHHFFCGNNAILPRCVNAGRIWVHLLSIFSAGSIFFGQNSVLRWRWRISLGDRVRDRVRVTHIQKRQFAGVQRLRCFSCTTSIAGPTQSVTHAASAMLVMGLCRVSDGVPGPSTHK